MLKINCLLTNKQIQNNLSDLIASIGYEIAANGQFASIENVYNALRKIVEVDIQTTAAIYSNVFDLNDSVFSSAEEVYLASDSGMKSLIGKEAQRMSANEIGRDNPIAATIKALLNSISPDTKSAPTVQKLMTTRLKKAANEALKKIGVKTPIKSQTSEEILIEAITLLNNNQYYGLGLMEGSQRLWDEFINEFDQVAHQVENENHYNAQKIRELGDTLMDGTFRLLLNTPEVNKVVVDALKNTGYTKKANKKGIGQVDVVDWNKVFNDPTLSFDTIMDRAIGGQFTSDQVDIIKTVLREDFEGILKDRAEKILDKQKTTITKPTKNVLVNQIKDAFGLKSQTGEFFLRTSTINDALRYVLKNADNGKYTKEDKEGNILINWSNVLGDRSFDLAQKINDVFGSYFNASQINDIFGALNGAFPVLLKEKSDIILEVKNIQDEPSTPSNNFAIDRLLDLYNYGIFQNANQAALMKVLGISNATQSLITSIQNIASNYNVALQNDIAKWSPTYLKSLERQIQVDIDRLSKYPFAENVVNKLSYFIQFSNASILANPQNILENVLSGAFGELSTLVQNPSGFMRAINDFASKWLDFSKGGVRVGHEKLNAFNTDGNLEDMYNNEVRKGKRADVIATTIPRVLLSSVDNAFKFSMINNMIVDMLRKDIVRQGLSKEQANLVLNEAYYGNNAEIEQVAKDLSANLIVSGLRTETTKGQPNVGLTAKERVMKSELALANMMTEGKFFQDLLNQWVADGKISAVQAASLNFDESLLMDIRGAAYSAASKELGHEADNLLVGYFGKGIEYFDKNIKAAKKNGDQSSYLLNKVGQLFLYNINKFRQGSLAWTYLGLQKASGLSLLQTVITDIAFPRLFKGRSGPALRYKNINFTDVQNRAQALKDYKALRQRLVRETLGPILGYSISAAILMFIKGTGDDDEKRKRLLSFRGELNKYPALKRLVEKISPIQLSLYFESLNYLGVDKIKGLGNTSLGKLEANGIEEVSMDNVDKVAKVLGYNSDKKNKLIEAVKVNNAIEIPSLLSLYYSPQGMVTAFKQVGRPNQLIQLGIDLFDVRKPDKNAVFGEFAGGTTGFGGILKSYDIWKNGLTIPEKIKGEYKIIKPHGFIEGFAYSTLNKDSYKYLFVNEQDYKLKLTDYPGIGEVGANKLIDNGISEITEANLPKVQYILGMKQENINAILRTITFHDKKIREIKGER